MKRLILIAILAVGCADTQDKSFGGNGAGFDNNFTNNTSGGAGGGFVPEVEDEFEFAEPAVLGNAVYVANSTLNSIAVIDSRSLDIKTAPVGFAPSKVVGPTNAVDGSRLFVLNNGSSTVSVVTPGSLKVDSVPVLRRANALMASPDATWAIAWYDEAQATDNGTPGDLSAATVITADGAVYQLAVGFRIERIRFADDSGSAMLLTDDGVSVVDFASLTGDALVPPVALLPFDLQEFDRTDREVVLDPNGEWAVARVASFDGLVLTELATGAQWTVPLADIPTDLDWVSGTTPRLLGMLGRIDYAFIATIPDGLIALAETAPVGGDMGAPDMGPPDMGPPDMGPADLGMPDMAIPDMGMPDMEDAGVDMNVDVPDLDSMPAEGFAYIALDQPNLGAAEVAAAGDVALLFSTLNAEKRAILLDLTAVEQRSIAFEKGVRGAVSDDRGTTFVVLHDRADGPAPVGGNPSDPEYIARSWGVSIVDVASAATRLVLTEAEPGQATLWRGDAGARLFMVFEASGTDASRDVLRVDLQSFSTDTFRLASSPEGLGRVDDAGKVFVHQIHPQGRITFVDVATDRRQTVTGYQLNSGID